jgi:hypothetical protein
VSKIVRRRWSEVELTLLRQHYADTPTATLAQALGRSIGQVYQAAERYGLKKSEAYLASEAASRLRRGDNVGAEHRFTKGQPAWNKGIKGVVGVQDGCRATQFRKGRPACEALNYQPIGSLRLSKDGYLERKVTDDPAVYPARRWVALHRLVWEVTHGQVPAGHIVVFKPGRKTTEAEAVTVDGLECITRAENMRRNTYHRYGPEIAKLIQLRGAINRQINKRAQHEQDPQ